MAGTVETIDLADAARARYLRYAMSVITARALPDVRDGLKPVQRRILYAMLNDLALRPTHKPVKSSKVVGQVLGNYHPHSDVAIYDAMVRMAQPFSLRYPLVEGIGNMGAITGDEPAAIRYTEARLQALGADLMETLGERTVHMRPNYDETGKEPEVLPTPVPLLLLNGAAGIAVGMATNIPPHNLSEVVKATTALIDKPDLSVAQLMRSLKGPDFPTGGEVLASKDELRKVYETGAGTVKVRGTYRVEESKAKGQRVARRHIIVDSVPYGTNTGQVLSKIKELLEAKKLPQITHVSDQTTEDDGVRIVLETRADDPTDPATIMAALYRLTPLETSYGISLTCLLPTETGLGVEEPQHLRPQRHCDLKTLLQTWLAFRFEVVTRSIEFRKARLEERIHILQGLKKVLDQVNDAIKLIRAAKDKADARKKLEKRFRLDEAQANAVLEVQLYRLAQLEVQKIEAELKEKEKEAARLGRLLKGEKHRWDLIKQELEDYAKRYGDARRTKLVGGEDEAHQFDPTALIKKEDTHVVLTAEGRLKRVKKLEDTEKLRIREDDRLLGILQGSTLAPVAFFTNFGSAYVMPINDVPPTAGFGEPIQKFFSFKDKERVVGALSLDPRLLVDPAAGLVVTTAKGQVVRAPLEPHLEPSTRAGRKFVRLAKGDEVVAVQHPEAKQKHLLMVTQKGSALRVSLEEVPVVAGLGKGKRGIKLGKGDLVVGATTAEQLVLETNRGGERTVAAGDVSVAEAGDEGQEVFRFGFSRVIPPPPVFYELEAEGEEG